MTLFEIGLSGVLALLLGALIYVETHGSVYVRRSSRSKKGGQS